MSPQGTPDSRRRVLRVIYGLDAGGTEMMLVRFLGEIQRREERSFDFEVCTFDSGGELRQELESLGIRTFSLEAVGLRGLLSAPLRLIRLIRRRGYEIVHAHLFPAEILVALVSFFARRPFYILGKHNAWTRRNRPWNLLLERFTLSRYTRVVCNSTAVEAAVLTRVPTASGKTDVVPNGIPFMAMQPAPGPSYDVIAVGNLRDDQKGIDILLHALAAIKGVFGRAIVVGDGPARAGLEELCLRLGLQGLVEFHGASSQVPRLLARARLFVLPSRYEGMPNALLEAMAVGLPVIATDVGGVTDIVTNGANGVIVPAENPAALAEAIVLLLQDDELAGRLATAAQARVRADFAISDHADRSLAIYEGVLAHEAAGPSSRRPRVP